MINSTNGEFVKKEIQLKKRTILKIVGRSDFGQNRGLEIEIGMPLTAIPPTWLPPTSGTSFK